MMFICTDCNVERKFDHTDYYDFDIYICPNCGSEFAFPADGYGSPDDDFNEPFDEPGEDDDFLWFEPSEEEMDELLDDGVYEGDSVIHQPYDDDRESGDLNSDTSNVCISGNPKNWTPEMVDKFEAIMRVAEKMVADRKLDRDTDLRLEYDFFGAANQSEVKAYLARCDGAVCAHCGTKHYLCVDHIYPRFHGGSNHVENLQLLCRSCNSRKGTKRDPFKSGIKKGGEKILPANSPIKHPFCVGDRLEHITFGFGVIERINADWDIMIVNFDAHGKRSLSIEVVIDKELLTLIR